MDTEKVTQEALKIRNKIKAELDHVGNPIAMDLNPVEPFKISDDIKLIIIGQDPTVKNPQSRRFIKKTLNLDKPGGNLKYYIENTICRGFGIDLHNVYATNIIKYFYHEPPARTPEILTRHLELNLNLLRNEVIAYPNVPVITLGEPVLKMLSNNNYDKVRKYWDFHKGTSGHNFMKCTENGLERPFYPFPHQPSYRRKFYSDTMDYYLAYAKRDSIIR